MSIGIRRLNQIGLLALVMFGIPTLAGAQPDGLLSGNIKYNSGQTVQPIFEGWTKNADGSYQFFFGYLNRNHVEQLHVPIGVGNQIAPGGPDRGQPSYFYTRFNRQVFSVAVPKDWGNKELIWTVVSHGRPERAVAWLRPDWEIAVPGAGRGDIKNQPPTLALASSPVLTLPATLTLTATVTDDGLPPARGGRGNRGGGGGNANRPPAFDNPEFKSTTPVNVPQVERPARPTVAGRLQVEWLVWRGPAAVTFTPPIASADQGQAVVTATFSQPGEYVLRARATDTQASTVQDTKVVVSAPSK
jgi:hypothetical protein